MFSNLGMEQGREYGKDLYDDRLIRAIDRAYLLWVGLTLGLLRAAVAFARSRGARIVEGYPVTPGPRLYTYMGSPRTFEAAGFRDVTPPGRERRVYRLRLT